MGLNQFSVQHMVKTELCLSSYHMAGNFGRNLFWLITDISVLILAEFTLAV